MINQMKETPLNPIHTDIITYVTELAVYYGFSKVSVPGWTFQYTLSLTNPRTQESLFVATIEDLHRSVINCRAKEMGDDRYNIDTDHLSQSIIKRDSEKRIKYLENCE